MQVFVAIMLVLLVAACDAITDTSLGNTSDEVVAVVKDIKIYKSELNNLLQKNYSKQDSVRIISQYLNNRIRKQLMVNKALSQIDINQEELERKVRDYRSELIVHQYEKYYINQNLDNNISEGEIKDYYENNSENFLLKQNIVKCLFAQIPKQAPRIQRFRRSIRSYPNAEIDDIKSYCYQFALKSNLEDSIWFNFDEVINGTPLMDIPNKVQFLRNNTYTETTDDSNIYFLRILDYKFSDEISPLEYIKDDIYNIIINKRRIELKKELENNIYAEAKKNKIFEIYNN